MCHPADQQKFDELTAHIWNDCHDGAHNYLQGTVYCTADARSALQQMKIVPDVELASGSHPLVGRSAPDFEFVDGTKLGELLTNGKGLFVDFDARSVLQALATGWSDRVTYFASDAKDRLGLSAVLVRPDGFVAWAGEAAPNYEEAAQAASRWFGEPKEARESAWAGQHQT